MSENSSFPRLRRLFRLPSTARRIEREVNDELQFHLESRVRDLICAGLSDDAARREAERQFGDVEAARAELATLDRRILARERRVDWFDAARQDIGYAVRGMRRQWGFTAAVVLTLALAIGANGAVFALIDPLLFRPPPGVHEPSSVRRLYTYRPALETRPNSQPVASTFSYPAFMQIRDALQSVARVAGYAQWDSLSAIRGTDTLVASLVYATADFLPLLGVRAATGRFFNQGEDDVRSPAPVVVISRAFARRAFGETGQPLGQVITFREVRYTVIGVADESFAGIDWTRTDAWVPFSSHPKRESNRRPWFESDADVFRLVVRPLRDRITDPGIEAAATTAYRREIKSTIPVEQGQSVLTGPILLARGPARAIKEVAISTRLSGVALIVLVIACANVGNLLLARALRRRREIAIRLALGISRTRLAMLLLLESLALAAVAGVAAMGIAMWVGGALRVALLPRVRWIETTVGPRVILGCVLLTLAAGMLAGVVPAVLASRRSFIDALKSGGRDGAGGRSRVQTILLLAQVGLSVVLVTGAVLFARSLRNVRGIDLGFSARSLITVAISFNDRTSHPELMTLVPLAAARIGSMPGVVAASYSTGAPMDSWMGLDLFRVGEDSAIRMKKEVSFLGVSPEYFVASEMPILSGRAFTPADNVSAERVMIVSTTIQDVLARSQPARRVSRVAEPHESVLSRHRCHRGCAHVPYDRRTWDAVLCADDAAAGQVVSTDHAHSPA